MYAVAVPGASRATTGDAGRNTGPRTDTGTRLADSFPSKPQPIHRRSRTARHLPAVWQGATTMKLIATMMLTVDGAYQGPGPAEKAYMRIDGHPDADDATAAPGGAHGRKRRNTTISGDTRVDWSEAFELVPSLAVGYIWHAGVHAGEVAAGLERIGFEIVSQVIWDKGLFAMGRSWYHWSHEPCLGSGELDSEKPHPHQRCSGCRQADRGRGSSRPPVGSRGSSRGEGSPEEDAAFPEEPNR